MFGSLEVAKNLMGAGIEAFDEGVESDHCGLFVDINMQALLGCNKSNITTPDQRHINSRGPEIVKKYR